MKAMPSMRWLLMMLLVPLQAGGAEPAGAADFRERAVIVFNENVPESRALAAYYARSRGIPEGSLVGLAAPVQETITRAEMAGTVEGPLRREFARRGWWQWGEVPGMGPGAVDNQKRLLVTVYGVPLKVAEDLPPADAAGVVAQPPAGRQNQASVDSELTLLGVERKELASGINNFYFNQERPFTEFNAPMMMIVGRIDGPTPELCRRMIDDALAVEEIGLRGRVYLDLARKGPGYEEGDVWFLGAGRLLGTAGWPVIIDAHPETLPSHYPMTAAAVYFGWWTRNADGPLLNPAFRFKRGAVAYHMHSFAAETLRSDAANWAGPLVARGAAAVLGTTWEPYLSLCTRADVFIDRLLKGYTLAEAAWMATPALSWMNVVLGDPLYRPFANVDSGKAPPEDADFAVYRELALRLAAQADKEPFLKALEEAAEKRASGTLWEALGLATQVYHPQDLTRAAGYFDKAGRTFPTARDRVRAYLHVPDMQRRAGDTAGAVADLKRITREFPDVPETQAARSWLELLAPPPPPQQ